MKKIWLIFFLLLPAIVFSEPLKVGVWHNPPLSITTGDEFSGFAVDIFKMIAKQKKIKYQFIHSTLKDLHEKLIKGEIDILLPFAYDDSRLSTVDFSKYSIFTNWGQIATFKNKRINAINDLSNLRIAVLYNSVFFYGPYGLKRLLDSFNINCKIIFVSNYVEAIEKLLNHEVDAALVVKSFAFTIKESQIYFTNIMVQPVQIHFAYKKGLDPAIKDKIDGELKKMLDDPNSYYYDMLNHMYHTGYTKSKMMFFIEKYYKTVAYGIFAILTILVVFNIVLRRKVIRKTAGLNKALSRLQVSEGRLNAVLSAIPSIIFIVDKKFTFVDILTSKEELLFVPKEVAIGKTFKDIFTQDKAEFFMNYTNIVIRIQMEVEFFYDLKIGEETRYFISKGVPLKIGNEIFALFQVSDNTELVLTNESLKKTTSELSIEKDKLNRILNSVKEMVLVTDKNGNITYINRAVKHFFPEISEGENIDSLELLSQENDGRYNLPIRDIVNQIFAEHTFKNIYLKKDNRKILLEGAIQPIFNYMSNVIGALIVLRDVTEEKKLEEEMIKADKLETIGRIAAGIAHDFNNYLGALQNYINVLKLENDDSIIEIASKMEVVINKSKSLTKQLLTFSKGGNFVLKRTNIATLLKTVSEFSLKGSGITLVENILDETICCEIDEGLFSQVISNLVVNAKEAVNNKGRIEVSLSKVYLCKANNYLLDEGDYAKISIKDNGPGIPEELRSKVFEPFFTTKSYGTGLGLTTSYSIVKQHNGYMDFINHPDGCEFVIFLKLTSCEGVNSGAEEVNIEKPEAEEEINILYMDDEDFLRDSFELLMTTLNCKVKTVSRGEEALEAVEREKYDMIVLDLTIREGMDGIKTIKAFHEKGIQSYFVVSSGYSEDPVLQHLKDYGFNDYLLKPYSLKETKDMLEKFKKYRSSRL